jgi:hypothetical protein
MDVNDFKFLQKSIIALIIHLFSFIKLINRGLIFSYYWAIICGLVSMVFCHFEFFVTKNTVICNKKNISNIFGDKFGTNDEGI